MKQSALSYAIILPSHLSFVAMAVLEDPSSIKRWPTYASETAKMSVADQLLLLARRRVVIKRDVDGIEMARFIKAG
jgi:hypothetical protein